jgi:hypothetical protein
VASSKTFAEAVVQPPLACLFSWRQMGTDPVSVVRHLRDFAEVFRYLHLLNENTYRTKFVEEFAKQAGLLAADAGSRTPPSKDDSCDTLGNLLSTDDVKKKVDALGKDEYDQRPYLAIAYAGLLAQLDHYGAATAVLANWLDLTLQLSFWGVPGRHASVYVSPGPNAS